MESKKEYYEDGLLMSVTYYLGGKEFDQYFYDKDGNLESHIILYDYGIRESHSPLIWVSFDSPFLFIVTKTPGMYLR